MDRNGTRRKVVRQFESETSLPTGEEEVFKESADLTAFIFTVYLHT